MSKWFLVDDAEEERKVFAQELSVGQKLDVVAISATEAEAKLADGSLAADGVLMDVDLSGETGMRNTGPGMAQNIRVAQQVGALPSFAIVRFSLRDRVMQNIGRDSSSDDIFDLKIEKDGLSDPAKRDNVQTALEGVACVYSGLEKIAELHALMGLDEKSWGILGHPAIEDTFATADRAYLKAGLIVRVLTHAGPLIDEPLLSIRLGVDRTSSPDWQQLRNELSKVCGYRGLGSMFFARWWARGLEQWWSEVGARQPLAGTPLDERVATLRKPFPRLTKLEMPKSSPGDRPWRICLLSYEESGTIVPVDPTRAVKVTPRSPLPSWMDPLVASLGPALQSRDDRRLHREDVKRFSDLARKAGL